MYAFLMLTLTLGFCVARQGADSNKLQSGVNWACGQGQANCTAIQSGQPCYLPNTLQNHASYAYNDYYQKMKSVGGTCDFDGTAMTTKNDPSNDYFLGSSNSSSIGFTPPAFGPVSPVGQSSKLHIPVLGSFLLTMFVTFLVVDVHIHIFCDC
ncbi:hypothetical protein DCAR_0102026 [Daucus carota subsp. sativus]|uniref:X8 domain-containing protein n=1 Tax=Daucus carota subsp. sativus TaxID=79200 RepID=A0AAF0W4G4_DAUCS|nr:hypothetical protein DCAR_0102026 [Daucus carota subsp. sativus]